MKTFFSATIIMTILINSLVFSQVFAAGSVEISTDVEVRASIYEKSGGDDQVVGDMRMDVHGESQVTENTTVHGFVRINADTAGIHQNAALNNRDSTKTIASIREAYVEFRPDMSFEEFVVVIGKQIMQNAVRFDFAEFNPLARRDQSEPFSVMDDHTQDGVVAASIEMQLSQDLNLFGECVVAGRNNPILATSSRDHWTRDVPEGMSYGDPDVGSEVNYYCRMWQERDSGTVIEVAAFHGSGSGVDHVEIDGMKINPVFAKETGFSLAADFTLGEWVTRLGCNAHFQESSDDFAVCIAEVDRIWQFDSGATLFVEMGYVNSFTLQESDVSIEGLDMRQALDNHLVATVEYSPREGVLFRGSGAHSLEREDYYVRLEAELLLDQLFPEKSSNTFWGLLESTTMTIRLETIGGAHSEDGFNTIFGEHDRDDRIMLMFTKEF